MRNLIPDVSSDFGQQVYEIMISVESNDESVNASVKSYIKMQLPRFVFTLQAIPVNDGDKKLLDVGGIANLIPCYQRLLGYKEITITSQNKDSLFVCPNLRNFLDEPENVRVSFFDAEFERFPFHDEAFDVVICLEVVEHLTVDPMAMMSELNRVCAFGGTLIMTTPNIASWRSVGQLVAGKHPSNWGYYSGVFPSRHNREYSPAEMELLIYDAGFDPTVIVTFDLSSLQPAHKWLRWCVLPLRRYWNLPHNAMRGDFILVSGRKQSKVRNRIPDWLYGGYREDRQILAKAGKYQGLI